MNHQRPSDSLSPEKMQLFLAGLSGLPEDEVRKAKVLYLKNAVSEYEAMEASLAAFGSVQGCFSIIPIFWPMIRAQRSMVNAQKKLMRERIENAMDVWADDLRGEHIELPRE